MTPEQNALVVLAEELGEVATEFLELQKQVSKATRFGPYEQRDLPTSNIERIQAEMNDLAGSIAHLEKYGITLTFDGESILKKIEKIERYAEYSESLGQIKAS